MSSSRPPPDDHPALLGFKSVGELLPPVRKPSRIKSRLIEASINIADKDPHDIYFQHTVFCQTALPYRDPGNAARTWQRHNGRTILEIEAGRTWNGDEDNPLLVDVGLPFGPKPRLVLCWLNTEAIRTGSRQIDVGDSLTDFVKRLRLSNDGRSIRVVKDQLTRIANAEIRILFIPGDQVPKQVQGHIVRGFSLWPRKDENQRILWPETVELSQEYFDNLQEHAVPLDERALRALSHSAMGLDIYSWLAQRLHRVDARRPQFVPWSALKDQFGWHYNAMFKFKQVFRHTLTQVLMEYRGARVELDGRGMTLRNSPPPVKGRFAVVRSLPPPR